MKYLCILCFFLHTLLCADISLQAHPYVQVAQSSSRLNIQKIFSASPITYFVLSVLSISACSIWLYLIFTLSFTVFLPKKGLVNIKKALREKDPSHALTLAEDSSHSFAKMLSVALRVRDQDVLTIMETMGSDVRRTAQSFWQRINLLNEIATLAPLIGLLGTVVGMLYGFYGFNRSPESLQLMLDGMGVAVGTTVGGLLVSIFSIFLYMSAKYRLVQVLSCLEKEIQEISLIIHNSSKEF